MIKRRCDKCGKLSNNRMGEYIRKDGTCGYINSQEDDNPGDGPICTDCRERLLPKEEKLQQLLSDICHQLHRHEVQYWLDAPGTMEERAKIALMLAREAFGLLGGRVTVGDVTEIKQLKE